MPNVPKIVQDRLKVAVAVDHPDGNVLGAFAEHSLPEPERAAVMEHLARCGDCREIIALALPETESVQTTVRVAPSPAWPVWRWGFAIAGIVVIASFGLLQYQRRTPKQSASAYLEFREREAKTAPSQPVPTVSEPTKTVDKPEVSSAPTKPVAAPVVVSRDAGTAQPARTAANSPAHKQFAHGPLEVDRLQQLSQLQQSSNNNQIANQLSPANPAPSPAAVVDGAGNRDQIPAAAEQVEVSAQSPPVQVEAQNSLTVQNEPMGAQSTAGHDETKVDKAKPAQTLIGNYKKLVGPAPEPPQNRTVGSAAVARWNINATGGLQRSFDQGATWQDVTVNEPPAAAGGAAGAVAANLAAPGSVTMERAKAKDAAVQKAGSAPTVFRAVVANGADVWAGGANASLYHSVDAGSHWTRIIVSSPGSIPTGDIVALEFPDPMHGKISTSTSETWVTSNGGQSWLKQ